MRRAPLVSSSRRPKLKLPGIRSALDAALARVEPLEGRRLLAAELISVTPAGIAGNGDSGEASVSQSGQFVAFSSTSNDLVASDTNGVSDVFLRDRSTGTTTLVSKNPTTGEIANGASFEAKVSNDGNFVVFVSRGSNLVAGDDPVEEAGSADVFRYNVQTGVVELVSMVTNGAFPDGDSGEPNISADGRFVAFSSRARNLGGPDTNDASDVFLRDMNRGVGDPLATIAVSVASGSTDETKANGRSFDPQVSDDGNFVSFRSTASNLNGGDTNALVDTYVRDVVAGANILVSISTAGASGNAESESNSISGDGKFVAFRSAASDLVPNDTNNAEDIFLRNLTNNTTTLLSVNRTGTASARGQSRFPWLSSNAGAVTFSSSANDLVAGDENNQEDVFLRDLVNGPIYLLSTSAANTGTGGNGASFDTYVSRDGRFVTFTSEASDLAAGDSNGRTDVYFTNSPINTDPGPDPVPPPGPPPPNPDPTPDTTAPTVSLPATQPGATPGATTYDFQVNLADDRALNTIVVGNLEVVRNGETLPAVFQNVIGSGTSAQAIYRVTFASPLAAAQNGTISVRLPADAIKDAAGNAAGAATLGDIAINVGDPNGPNLTAAIAPKFRPGTIILGSKQARGAAKVTVTNTGAAITKQPVVVSLFLSDNPTLDATTDTQLGTQTKPLTLKQGKGKGLAFKFSLPTGLGNGSYFLIASADANNAILEANEGDNQAVSGAPVALAQPFFDLRGTVARPSGLTPGGNGLVVVDVINDGNVALTRPVTITLAASTDASADASDTVITTFTKRLSIKPGATKATPIKFTLPPALVAGTYFITATIDPLGEIAETSKSNNTAASEAVGIA